MKTVAEMRETAQKTAYAVVGAPVVAGRRIADYTGKLGRSAQKQLESWVTEGHKITAQLKERKVVADLREKVDFEQLQERVEKLRDQLEEVLANWRENFKPADEPAAAPAEKTEKPKASAGTPKAKAKSPTTTKKKDD